MDESDSVFQACNLMLTDRETQFQSCLKTSKKERVPSTVDTDHSGLKLPPWGILKKKLEMLNLARRGNFFSAVAPNLNFWVNFGKYVTE